ncbi:branched-chain amino acid aminotransferase [Heliobacterium undosum]|uniref:Branched-chain-amino-acid aminotransferase n=1 Tax=Heliomicrobium undosum TaxID=121734 RepID=A0A845L1A6_9FIRM|nr:branched-chain amino acid aminotransferase [Heliomicrobium undosum]MZP28745.1 branched-chain amino acid aminotransferase [Heliomicrobium undosum]
MSMELQINLAPARKEKPAADKLGFGTIFTDHMFVMDYSVEQGWHNAQIMPYGPLLFDPSVMVFHYGQAVFEGMKAFRTKDDRVVLFRPERYIRRMSYSIQKLCIPAFDEAFVVNAIKTLVDIERDWVYGAEGTALYIRPFIIATDPYLGVRPSNTYKFMVILSPVGAYYKEGFNPVKIYITDEFTRAAKQGLGDVKTPANYAASLYAGEQAKKMGFTQVLWLDPIEKKYIEEVGTMNVFFKIGGKVVTPALSGSILSGVTRDSVLQVLNSWGIAVSERAISVDEIFAAYDEGRLEEVFGTGTAAVISPVGLLRHGEREVTINGGVTGELSARLFDAITGMQYGKCSDDFGWIAEV